MGSKEDILARLKKARGGSSGTTGDDVRDVDIF